MRISDWSSDVCSSDLPLLTRGDVSVRGRSGEIEYEASLNNDDSARSGAGGPTLIYDGADNIIERRKDIWHTHYDTPKLSGRITWDPAGDTAANFGGHYQRDRKSTRLNSSH